MKLKPKFFPMEFKAIYNLFPTHLSSYVSHIPFSHIPCSNQSRPSFSFQIWPELSQAHALAYALLFIPTTFFKRPSEISNSTNANS